MGEDTQDLLLSTTFQGALIALVGALLAIFKVDIGTDELTAIITGLCVVIGTGLVIYGRIKATKPISSIGGIKI